MTDDRALPAARDAEEALLGACLLNEDAIYDARRTVTAADFQIGSHQQIFDAVVRLHDEGAPADPVTVADLLAHRGVLDQIGGPARLVELQGKPAAVGSAGRYALIVAQAATLRRLIVWAAEVSDRAYASPSDIGGLLEDAQAALGRVKVPGVRLDRFWSVEDFLAQPLEQVSQSWVIPGLLRRRWRAIIVASEGRGKTTLFRMLATAAARGRHPFSPSQRIEPQRVLLVDLENPADVIREGLHLVDAVGDRGVGGGGCWLLHREEGLVLRRRADRAVLEAALEECHPQLVCMGPLNKFHQAARGEAADEAAGATLAVLDELRVRHDFALVVEHHAPKGQGGHRDLNPFGSQRWMAWPEFGKTLAPTRNRGEVEVGDFRGQRPGWHSARWPSLLQRGRPGEWPFVAVFEDAEARMVGTGQHEGEAAA